MFDANDLKHIARFYEIYDMLSGKRSMSAESIKKKLVKDGMAETTARRLIADFKYPLNENLLTLNETDGYEIYEDGVEDFIDEFAKWLGQPVWPRWQVEKAIEELKENIDYSEFKLDECRSERDEYKDKCNSLRSEVDCLRIETIGYEACENALKRATADKEKLGRSLEEAKQKLYDRNFEIQKLQETVDQLQRDISNPFYMLAGFFRALFRRG